MYSFTEQLALGQEWELVVKKSLEQAGYSVTPLSVPQQKAIGADFMVTSPSGATYSVECKRSTKHTEEIFVEVSQGNGKTSKLGCALSSKASLWVWCLGVSGGVLMCPPTAIRLAYAALSPELKHVSVNNVSGWNAFGAYMPLKPALSEYVFGYDDVPNAFSKLIP